MIIIVMLLAGMIQALFAQVEIKGQIKSAKDSEVLEFVNVVLQTTDSIFVMGTTTDQQGHFTLTQVAPGDYRLYISSLGYATKYIPLASLDKDITLNDITLEDGSVSLDEITVSGSNMTSKSDRMLVYPSERQVEASSNGLNLLQQLMLPKVQINPLFNEIKLPGGGEIQLRINGVKVEQQDIVALQPSEVIRIEYHDNPGLRYGNAEVVLDYIVRRPETGGSFGVNLSDAPFVAWGNNSVNGKINHKKSEFSVNYSISHRDFYGMTRDNEEHFKFADGSTLIRREAGESGHGEMYWQNLSANYSFLEPGKRQFNATLRYWSYDQRHMDYKGILYNVANPSDRVDMIDRTADNNKRPAIDLYYLESLPNDQTLVFNLVGTYNTTDNHRIYREGRENIHLTDINNIVKGDKYSIIGEAIYEKKLGTNSLSGGLRYNHSFSDNTYLNGHDYTTKMDQSQAYAYVEFKGKLKKLDYTLGAGVTRDWFKQEGEGDGYEDYTFNPRIILHYNLPGQSYIRLRGDIRNSSPSLSNLSAVEQVIDSIQVQRGNPQLNPYLRYSTELTYELQKGIFYGNLWGTYEYQPNAIMDEKRLEGNRIVQTWDNQRNWQRLASRLTLRVGPLKDILQVSATGGVNHYMSNGNTYSHKYTNWFTDINVSATYKKFMLAFMLQTNWNWFYGETLSGGENIHMLMLSYKHKNLSLTAGMFNPFSDNYKQDTENWSEFASYKRSNYLSESSQMFILQLTYNFSFGRSFKSGGKRVSNSDNDSGVMSTGK